MEAVQTAEAKAELETLLSSGVFVQAPSLAQFLSYICGKSFEGQANQIKEYNIAVEALGRPPDFDQKKDSIVRVEAHRLRKRLRQYYEGEGASHKVQIFVPAGQYIPQFLYRPNGAISALEVNGAPESAAGDLATVNEHSDPSGPLGLTGPSRNYIAELESPQAETHFWKRRWPMWAVSLLVIALALVTLWKTSPRARQATVANTGGVEPATAPAGIPEGDEIRILAGSSVAKYVDRLGNVWLGDRYFKGGNVFSTPQGYHISRTKDAAIFQSRREGDFSYDIPLKPGTYELHLYFAETLFGEGNIAGGGETYRMFNITANDEPLITNLDVIADAPGSNTADVKVFKDISPAGDGYLHLKFLVSTKENPFVNAIEIVPGIPRKLRPVRIVARETAVSAKDGQLWGADRYVTGGQTVVRTDPVRNTADPELYMGERYGNFTYTIPVTPGGRYTATLRFCESWFGPKKPANGGAGKRVFDVYCNGVALLRNFDIFKEAGGEDRALDKTFHALEANAQGKLVFSFVPVKNYACVNAIEVLDEAK